MPSITIDISKDELRMLKEMAASSNSSPEFVFEQLSVVAITNWHFMEIAGPRHYFEGRPSVSREEADATRATIVDPIVASVGDQRPELVLFGLVGAAWQLAVRLCKEARYKYPQQHAEFLIREMVQAVDFADPRKADR